MVIVIVNLRLFFMFLDRIIKGVSFVILDMILKWNVVLGFKMICILIVCLIG